MAIITDIQIDGTKYQIANDITDTQTRLQELSHRLNHIDGQQYLTMEEAFKRVGDAAHNLALRLASVECDLYDYLNKLNEASASETSETSDEILSGEFWDEIQRNNMFLKNLI